MPRGIYDRKNATPRSGGGKPRIERMVEKMRASAQAEADRLQKIADEAEATLAAVQDRLGRAKDLAAQLADYLADDAPKELPAPSAANRPSAAPAVRTVNIPPSQSKTITGETASMKTIIEWLKAIGVDVDVIEPGKRYKVGHTLASRETLIGVANRRRREARLPEFAVAA